MYSLSTDVGARAFCIVFVVAGYGQPPFGQSRLGPGSPQPVPNIRIPHQVSEILEEQCDVIHALFPLAQCDITQFPLSLSEMVTIEGEYKGSTAFGEFSLQVNYAFVTDPTVYSDDSVSPELKRVAREREMQFTGVLGMLTTAAASREVFGMAVSETVSGKRQIKFLLGGPLSETALLASSQSTACSDRPTDYHPLLPLNWCSPLCDPSDEESTGKIVDGKELGRLISTYQTAMAAACTDYHQAVAVAELGLLSCVGTAMAVYAIALLGCGASSLFGLLTGGLATVVCVASVTGVLAGAIIGCEFYRASAVAAAGLALTGAQQAAGQAFYDNLSSACLDCPTRE